ncbi:hypothetical protein H0E87_023491 [Populus deltoides]|uniref:cysteine dioxygenase n=1 Tax=Populus deltoides TaxID=3696 RepID=A0A8T2XG53_POPDE|nr:hypothetical protein H0E87_023491 [Populus deltoides]
MTIEATVEPRREPTAHVNRLGFAKRHAKKKRSKKTKKCAPTMALPDLYVSCKEVFKGPGTVPLHQDVKRLCHMLDNMKLEDFGLSCKLEFFNPKAAVIGTPRVTYTIVYECDKFSMCVFFLPATAVIPLHNHPGMTVFSKLLMGTMHVKSYDWVDPPATDEPDSPAQVRLAKLEADSVFTAPCHTSVLYPTTGGNIHQFTAITPCAVLDVLGPPYSNEDGRDCSYYKDFPYTAFPNGEMGLEEEEGDCYAWLEESTVPENLQMFVIKYLGPQVDDSSS